MQSINYILYLVLKIIFISCIYKKNNLITFLWNNQEVQKQFIKTYATVVINTGIIKTIMVINICIKKKYLIVF